MHVLGSGQLSKGNLRETFFANQAGYEHALQYDARADFFMDGKYIFEIGGKDKPKKQLTGTENAFVVSDDIEYGSGNRIPLWMFGLMY